MHPKFKIIILIFLLAISARLIYLEEVKDTFLFSHPIVDSGAFESIGAKMAEGKIGDEARLFFRRIPLYYKFIAFFYKLAGRNVYIIYFIQAIMGALNSCLIYLLGEGIFNRKVGIISGVITSLYWPLIAFGAKFLPVNLAIFFSILMIICLHKFLENAKISQIFASGVFLALASISTANMLLLFPVLVLWLFYYCYKNRGVKKGMFFSVVFIAGFLFMLLPPLLKVSSARKQVVPIQDNYAIGVYFGLDLEHINIRPGSSWKRIMREMLEKDLVELGQRDSFWFAKTKELILSNPKKYLKNFLEKIYIFWNYYEFSPRESINYFRSESKFLSMPLFNFGSIMALSILGMLLGWNRFREKAMPIYIFVITYQVSLLPFMPLGRYRLPIAPFLTIFASYGVYEIYEVLRKREWGNLVKYISLVLPIFILTNTNPMLDYLGNFSRPHYHKALRHLEINNTSNALVELRKALLTHPNDADIYEAMGDVYIRMDDLQRAEASYKKALAIENEFPEAKEKLGIVYAKKGDLQEAKAVFEEILSSSPTEYPSTHINLGNCYRMEGDFRMAEKEYKRALTLAPNNLQALYRLATLYDEADNPEAATIWSRYRELIEKLK